jgi:uncharacterized protein
MDTIVGQIARELQVDAHQVEAAVRLLAEGATVPFIVRYRKEATGGLTEVHLRMLEERLYYLQELEERRAAIVRSIEEQGKLTPELHHELASATTKALLEDLYLPYRPKRRSRSVAARGAGLEPLAQALLSDPQLTPELEAARFANPGKGVPDATAALDGARWILMDQFAEDPDVLGRLREYIWERAFIESRVVAGKQEKGAKFADYFAASEPVRAITSHRALAMFRGRKEGILRLAIVLEPTEAPAAGVTVPALVSEQAAAVAPASEAGPEPVAAAPTVPELMIAERFGIKDEGWPAHAWLKDVVRRAWRMKVFPHLQVEIEKKVRENAEREAIRVFGRNLRDLLLAAPAGPRVTMGLDPGLRTGVKAAVIDTGGQLLATATVYPHQPRNEWEPAVEVLAELAREHQVELVSIGSGTGSRETDRLVSELVKRHPDLGLHKVVVSEAGASAYSASRLASRELAGIDVSLRGAVSIARRLQDPLAELVKIEPRAIGVGQYQHDVNQAHLARALGGIVEDCVNAVGTDVNTASAALLGRVSGLNRRLADIVVAFRNTTGPFRDRRELLNVPGLGEKTYEQAAGFLRIRDGLNPLDASGVHPETYPVVERICQMTGRQLSELIGQVDVLRQLSPAQLADERFGEPTIRDILAELEQPGRDPRPQFRTACFAEGVEELEHLRSGMTLEGIVTNVAAFGAFVDIGVHQDGLVHVSRLADRFIKDPRDVVKAGDIVRVKVVEVDLKRRRIALTMRLNEARAVRAVRATAERKPKPQPGTGATARRKPSSEKRMPQGGEVIPRPPLIETAMSAAFSRLLKRP